MAQAPMWQFFVSTLGGTLVGFFLALATTAWRERANLDVRIRGSKERLFVTEKTPGSGNWTYIVREPSKATEAVLTVPLLVTNHSAAYDAISDITLEIDGNKIPARIRADAAFPGLNIPPHQAVMHNARFFLPKPATPGRDNLSIRTPDWVWSKDRPYPAMRLEWTSVRRRIGGRQIGRVEPVDADSWITTHKPRTEIGYLHSRRS
jgi:hypothetical protein